MIRILCIFLLLDMQLIPPWELRKCPTEQYACYNFEQAKRLLQLDAELQLRLLDCEACGQLKGELEKTIEDQKQIIQKLEDNVSTLTTLFEDRVKITGDLTQQIQKLDRFNVFGKALPWVVATVVVFAAGGFVLGWMLHP